jgi:hypothetical protein
MRSEHSDEQSPSTFKRSIIPAMSLAHRGSCASLDVIFVSHTSLPSLGRSQDFREPARSRKPLLSLSGEPFFAQSVAAKRGRRGLRF